MQKPVRPTSCCASPRSQISSVMLGTRQTIRASSPAGWWTVPAASTSEALIPRCSPPGELAMSAKPTPLHVAPVFAADLVQGAGDLAERGDLDGVHQGVEHVSALARHVLQAPQLRWSAVGLPLL